MRLASSLLLRLLGGYRRWVSPRLPPMCIHTPSCSRYAQEAVLRHGAWRGVRLTASRLRRCCPGHRGGHDPVPLVYPPPRG